MLVQHLCYYLTDWNGITPRQEDWDTNKVVKCLKGEVIKGYAQISIGGLTFRLEDTSKEEFLLRLWSEIGKGFAESLKETTAIVPIPNSSGIIGATANYRTLLFAQHIAASSSGKLVAIDSLRWKSAAPAVHKQGGHRAPEPRYDNLQVIERPNHPVVLFDDVVTSGSSFIAAVWRLSEVGNAPTTGLVVARRTPTQEPNMFEVKEQELASPQRPLFYS
jgi:hypothetical protein